MIAPNEKHLEDYLVANINSLGLWTAPVKNIGRQVVLPSGRIDLLVQHPTGLIVIEIKKDELRAQTVTQTLRYIHDLDYISLLVWSQLAQDEPGQFMPRQRAVTGLIVCHDTPNQERLTACAVSEIGVATYEYVDSDYQFKVLDVPGNPNDGKHEAFADYALGHLGDLFRSIYLKRISKIKGEQ